MRLSSFLPFIILVFSLTSCSKEKKEIYLTAEENYKLGIDLLSKKKYSKATKKFDKIYFENPGNPITPYAEIMQAYSLYLDGKYDESIDILSNFLRYHPMHEDVDYVLYLRSLCYYMQISDTERDQSKAIYAKESFEDLINSFPSSKYSSTISEKINIINEYLAGKEMQIGREYLRIKNPAAAVNRFNTVKNDFSKTSQLEESLYRLVEGYLMLGLKDEAIKNSLALEANFKDGIWYKKSTNLLKKY
jgi:outer membrane protein assembly factor BamD